MTDSSDPTTTTPDTEPWGRVAEDGGTVAEVVKGELRYTDETGSLVVVKKGRSVTFRKAEKR